MRPPHIAPSRNTHPPFANRFPLPGLIVPPWVSRVDKSLLERRLVERGGGVLRLSSGRGRWGGAYWNATALGGPIRIGMRWAVVAGNLGMVSPEGCLSRA